jgi:DNA processing protein
MNVPSRSLDEETLARAVLTYCLDSADAMMYALLKGTGSAAGALRLIADGGPGKHEGVVAAACKALDAAFINGITRWGRTINARGMSSFHGSLASWQQRLATLPSHDPQQLECWFTAEGTQWIIAPHSPYWPAQLADLSLRTDWAAPLCLWGRGDPETLVSCSKPVGIVGSRGVSDYGRRCAYELARQAARSGHVVVSGGALGTDAAAHWGALAAMDEVGAGISGRTVAVFAGGLNHIGPKSNARLFERIVEGKGALVSELCPATIPEARRFLLRNRLIAALSSTVIVAQARARSGALNTAGWAGELNRELYAVPGDVTMPHNTGCNRLIQEGKASIVCSLSDIGELCHEAHRPHTTTPSQDEDNPPSDDSGHCEEGGGTNATGNDILQAIRACRSRFGDASADGILSILNESHPGEYSIATIMQELGAMELSGIITMGAGRISIAPSGA